jgi:hypothetical protein
LSLSWYGCAGSGSGAGGSLCSCGCKARDESRSGNCIGKGGRVQVEENAGVVRLIQRGTFYSSWCEGSTSSDLDIKALGVVLRTVDLSTTVKCNNFMPKDVVSCCQVGGNLDNPGIPVGNKDISRPLPALERHINQATSTNLEEFELGLVDVLTVPGAFCEIVNDWSLVRFGPCVPLQADLIASPHSDVTTSCLSASMADDIRVPKALGFNVSIVSCPSSPANDGVDIWVPRESGCVITPERHAVGNEPVHMPVGSHMGRREDQCNDKIKLVKRHVGGWRYRRVPDERRVKEIETLGFSQPGSYSRRERNDLNDAGDATQNQSIS